MDVKDLVAQGSINLVHAQSKKSGVFYTALVLDLGYKKKFLNFSFSEIAELLDLRPSELKALLDKSGEFEATLYA